MTKAKPFVLLMSLALAAPAPTLAQTKKGPVAESAWLGEELPLPLAVRSPEDLAVKVAAERAYLVFNLLAGGKLAWDNGNFAQAATKWERLLSLPRIDLEMDRTIRPLAVEARRRAGGESAIPLSGSEATSVSGPPAEANANDSAKAEVSTGTVKGLVLGGGSLGPGGTVVWLKRKDGPTPRPAPLRGRFMNQKDKLFSPHVLPVTVGSKVAFKNEDTIFHNVFSLSRPNEFDGGLYRDGSSYSKTFESPGAVQVLCNIHAQMLGYIVVVDSPWFAQAGVSGRFSIRNVPTGSYELLAWHEGTSDVSKVAIEVAAGGVVAPRFVLGAERSRTKFVPDKYGKPRQVQLGY
jgi:hypothetical protein